MRQRVFEESPPDEGGPPILGWRFYNESVGGVDAALALEEVE